MFTKKQAFTCVNKYIQHTEETYLYYETLREKHMARILTY